MRLIGEVMGRRRADRLVNFLSQSGVEANAREDGEDRYSIWVLDEDLVATAEEHYRAFKIAPDAAVFDAPAPKRAEATKATKRSRYIDVRTEVFGRRRLGGMPVTLTMIILSVVLTLVTPSMTWLLRALHYSEYAGTSFPEIGSGEVWRLITPIFLHGGMLHLFFNMLWLYQLGGAIEANEGSVYFTVFALITAAFVNTAQYFASNGPLFIGMSGVVYALFGYTWMMARHQAASRYMMARETAIFMVAWMVICMAGLFPGVANTQHVAGLAFGVAWGFLRSGYILSWIRRRRFRRRR